MKKKPQGTIPVQLIDGVLYVHDAFGAYVPIKPKTQRKLKIRTPSDCLPALLPYRGAEVESFLVITLDGAHQMKAVHEVTRGLINKSLVHPREVFNRAIVDMAAAIIVAHNHPSGNLVPSDDDLVATRKLVEASKLLSIPVLDHLIISQEGYLSLKTNYEECFK